MKNYFENGRFYPQNFILQDCDMAFASDFAEKISRKAKEVSPDSFNAKETFFNFQLRYCAPYEYRNFRELKRLQEEAISNTRFKDEYRGYIVTDLTEWAGHTDEELFFEVIIPFLYDMSEFWKYIFVFRDGNCSKSDIENIRNTIWSVTVNGQKASEFSYESFIKDKFDREYGIKIRKSGLDILSRAAEYPENMTREKVEAMIHDMSVFLGDCTAVDTKDVVEYLTDRETFFCSLLTECEFECFTEEIAGKEKIAC